MGFILTILIIVALFWVLRLLFPFILLALVRRQQKRFSQQGGGANPFGSGFGSYQSGKGAAQPPSDSRKEGEVRVESSSEQQQQSRSIGEYVDFEEKDTLS